MNQKIRGQIFVATIVFIIVATLINSISIDWQKVFLIRMGIVIFIALIWMTKNDKRPVELRSASNKRLLWWLAGASMVVIFFTYVLKPTMDEAKDNAQQPKTLPVRRITYSNERVMVDTSFSIVINPRDSVRVELPSLRSQIDWATVGKFDYWIKVPTQTGSLTILSPKNQPHIRVPTPTEKWIEFGSMDSIPSKINIKLHEY